MIGRTVWTEHLDHFTQTVITADLRGHGDTGATAVDTYEYDLFIDDLASLIEAVDGEPILAGCSLGAETALLYAQENPATITGVVAAGVAPRSGLMQYVVPVLARMQYTLTRLLGHDRVQSLLPASPEMEEEEYLKFAEMMLSGSSVWDETNLAEPEGDLSIPVTLVRGPSEDEFSAAARSHAHVTVETLPEGGHIAALQNPAEFAAVVERLAA